MEDESANGDRYALRQWIEDSPRQKAKGLLGSVLMTVFPARAAALRRSDFTHHGRRASLLNRLIGAGIAYRALRDKDFDSLADYHRKFWGGERAKAFHDKAPVRFDAAFRKFYTPVIDELEAFLGTNGKLSTFCEIGSGSGLLMDYLAKRFEQVERLIGIDLCETTSAAAREAYPDPRMEFVAGDALEYIREKGRPNWVYLTHNGVLEYFEPEAVKRFLDLVADSKPAAVVLIEPIGLNHDLDTQTESWPYGQEFSFSHNYPYLLEQRGFRVVYRHEVTVYGVRVILVLASIE